MFRSIPRDGFSDIGTQPGDEEDRAGKPFVGSAGQLLDEILRAAEIDREKVYLTNAVKHFSYVQRGKRRLHKKPRRIEVVSCRIWLENELVTIRPQAVVCLGATAATSLVVRVAPSYSVRDTGNQGCERRKGHYDGGNGALTSLAGRSLAVRLLSHFELRGDQFV